MTGKTHIAIGVAAGLTLSLGKPINEQIFIVAASALGSLIPDLDHAKSKLNQKLLIFKRELYRIIFFIAISALFLYLYMQSLNTIFALLSIIFLFIGVSTHRGFTHSILGFLIFAYIIKNITDPFNLDSIAKAISLGYLSHLLADFLTPKGIKLFYPLNTNIASPIIINPNSGIDTVIFTIASIYSLALLFKLIL